MLTEKSQLQTPSRQEQPALQKRRPLPRWRSLPWSWLSVPAGLLGVLLIWQGAVWIGGYPEFVLPSPATVAAKGWSALLSGLLWRHLRVTLIETLLGFALGFVSATAIGYGLARSPLAERLASPWIVSMQAVPIVAIAPLLVIWFGFGLLSKILVTALIVFFPILITTIVGVRSVDPALMDLMRLLRATPWQIFRTVELPSALPVLLGGVKLGVTLAVVGAVVGEFAGAREGLGALINIAGGSLFDTALVFVSLITLAAMALTLYGLVSLLERRLLHWRA